MLALPILTSRLELRPWRAADIDAFHALRGDASVVRYLYARPLDRKESEAKLAAVSAAPIREGEWLNLAIERSSDGVVVGDAGVRWSGQPHLQAEVGYQLIPGQRGHGYATEAARALISAAFADLGARRVCGRLDARNDASARVLERLGMRLEGRLVENENVKGEWTDELIYAVLASEWTEQAA